MTLYRETSMGQHTIDRAVLRDVLNRSLTSPLAVIVAPAGAGKTTLLRQWSAGVRDAEVVFLDVGQPDDDPGHFLRRLVSQLGVARNASENGRLAVPFGDFPRSEWSDLVATVLEQSPETVIIVDNMHRFATGDLAQWLGRLIDNAPGHAHFVLSSRADPPFPLSPYRLRDELLEIGRDDLAFTLDEATELLERLAGRSLPPAHVHSLWSRTEGWAAGLQLAGLGLRNHPDPEAFVSDFRGSDRFVAEYLVEEVLSTLTPERRRMLLRLGVLDDMCAELVEAVTGSADGQALLEALERESMFLVPLDGHGEWFRFHRLFSDLLRSRMRSSDPADEVRILTAAADWSLTRGRVKHAMQYLLRAQARDGALEAILADAAGSAPFRSPAGPPVMDYQPAAPAPELVRAEVLDGARQVVLGSGPSRPWGPGAGLGYVAAQVLWRARPEISPESARRRLSELESEFGARPPGAVGTAESAELAEVLVAGGRANFLAGNVGEARKWLARARTTACSAVVERIAATSALSLVEAWSGNVDTANALVSETVETARDAELLDLPAISDAYLASVLTSLNNASPNNDASTDTSGPASTYTGRGMSRGDGVAALGAPLSSAARSGPAAASAASSALFDRAITALARGDSYPVRKIVTSWRQLVPAPRPLAVVQHEILLAWLADQDNAQDDVRRHLAEALRVAEIHALVDVFVRAGPPILNRLVMVSGPRSPFVEKIVARAQEQRKPATAMVLPEPLTERELELLSYLPTRMSNVELARRFFVSVNTIKTHLAHIYRKLDVPDRNAAIVRSRDLGLL